jgi:hypothetical protein
MNLMWLNQQCKAGINITKLSSFALTWHSNREEGSWGLVVDVYEYLHRFQLAFGLLSRIPMVEI